MQGTRAEAGQWLGKRETIATSSSSVTTACSNAVLFSSRAGVRCQCHLCAARAPGLHAWQGALPKTTGRCKHGATFKFGLVFCVKTFAFRTCWKQFFLWHSVLQGILSSFSLLVSTQMQDLWCLVTLPFLLFISCNGFNSPLGRPLRVAAKEPWAVDIPFPGGNKQ